jgi:RNA polymerase sigma factor (sigma-70 family)
MTTFNDAKTEALWNECGERVVWGAAGRFARALGGRPEDYVGSLTLLFARAARSYDPAHGAAFSTYFNANVFAYLLTTFYGHEGETQHLMASRYRSRNAGRGEGRFPVIRHAATFEQHLPAPARDEEARAAAVEVLELLAATTLLPRELDVLRRVYFGGASYADVAREQSCSRQRIEQIARRALDRVRRSARARGRRRETRGGG